MRKVVKKYPYKADQHCCQPQVTQAICQLEPVEEVNECFIDSQNIENDTIPSEVVWHHVYTSTLIHFHFEMMTRGTDKDIIYCTLPYWDVNINSH